jgi:2-succinyl-6-hydroxy-2,4-cyclohexadiene-1-carboxylate synthase
MPGRRMGTVAALVLCAVVCACSGPRNSPASAVATDGADPSGRPASGLYWEASGSGSPVVLVHGFSLDRRMWNREVAALAPRHRVFRYDQRGHGQSAAPAAPFSYHEDLLSVFDSAGLERAAIVGLSSGAEVAIDFALAYPERVSRLVLASPSLSGYKPQGPFDWMGPVMEALRGGDAKEATKRWVETPLMRLADPDSQAAMSAIVLSNWQIWTYSREHLRMPERPAVGRLGEISIPTLVVVGTEDLPDTHRVAELLGAGIAGVESIELQGAGHLVNLAAPDAFDRALSSFLDRNES